MKKKIKLKTGDIVDYTLDGKNTHLIVDGYDGCTIKEFEEGYRKVIKVERPVTYKTIYEAPKEILDKEEKEYLENVIRPFRNKVEFIVNSNSNVEVENQYIAIKLSTEEWFSFPYFKKGTMYKGMKPSKRYTLEELGLFEGE